jgi:uncharacterized protein (TIGR03000 family)
MLQRLLPAAALGMLLLVPATGQAQFRSFRGGMPFVFAGDPFWISPWYSPYGYYPGYYRSPYGGSRVTINYPPPAQPTNRPRDSQPPVEQKQRIQEFYPSGKSVSPETGPPPGAKDAPASIEVRVPAGAEVWIDSAKTKQQGGKRAFLSPTLTAGKDYVYEIRAAWREDGREQTETRRVTFRAGAQVSVDFTKPVEKPETLAMPKTAK